jgi:hypothetical protein
LLVVAGGKVPPRYLNINTKIPHVVTSHPKTRLTLLQNIMVWPLESNWKPILTKAVDDTNPLQTLSTFVQQSAHVTLPAAGLHQPLSFNSTAHDAWELASEAYSDDTH